MLWKLWKTSSQQVYQSLFHHQGCVMASGAGIQSYYEFGVGIPFKKSLWKSIKNSITMWNQFYFCAIMCLGWDVFTVILPFVERILLGSEVSLHNMLFQLAVSLWPFTVFCEDLGKWFSSNFILWLEWMIKLIYRKWNVRLKAHSLLPIYKIKCTSCFSGEFSVVLRDIQKEE